jgi:hypothetical protein
LCDVYGKGRPYSTWVQQGRATDDEAVWILR